MDAVMRCCSNGMSADFQYCPGVPETMMHLVEESPACRCPVVLDEIHKTWPEAMEWLTRLKPL